MPEKQVLLPDSPNLLELCEKLRQRAQFLESPTNGNPDIKRSDLNATSLLPWPGDQLAECADYGVFRWFLPKKWGGFEWNESQIVCGYLALASACLTTTFVITQRVAALRRIVSCDNEEVKDIILPKLATGKVSTTVGISHLTTSRRHLDQPVLLAEPTTDGFLVNGFSPWITGASFADHLVVGAALADGTQILFMTNPGQLGVTVQTPFDLIALTASQTGAVQFDNVLIPQSQVLKGPIENVLGSGIGGGAGGLQTSTLAVGLAQAAIEYFGDQAKKRLELASKFEALNAQLNETRKQLLHLAENGSSQADSCTKEELRTLANSLVLRATQSAMVAAKGAGFVSDHPVGRWCRQALFFLVWSCPQPVLDANLCELVGLDMET